MPPYDALVVLSFGGPDAPADVAPFLENVTAGRQVPAVRLAAVAAQYEELGGVSPHNGAIRSLIASLRDSGEPELVLPLYWGNRNWHPFLADTVAQMAADGIGRALAFVTSGFGSASSCRQYSEDITRARATVGARAPAIDKLRLFFNHPRFIEATVASVARAIGQIPPADAAGVALAFTAHSLPVEMAAASPYVAQLREAAELVVARLEVPHPWTLVFQSRSGPPTQPWLEPDIQDHLSTLAGDGTRAVVVVPLGFVYDHMEVVYDLDVRARKHASALGLTMVRASTVATEPAFVSMIAELVHERTVPGAPRRSLGPLGPSPDACPADCTV